MDEKALAEFVDMYGCAADPIECGQRSNRHFNASIRDTPLHFLTHYVT